MKSIAIITARGGSKRIPKKNIKDFCGKPIIAYTIEAALESNCFDVVMVSTDSEEIGLIAKRYGAEVPFYRSEKNSDDFATTVDVLVEVIEKYEQLGMKFDTVCCLYPTAPFVTAKKIKDAIQLLKEEDCDSIMPVVEYSFPPQRGNIIKEGKLKYLFPEYSSKRSQDIDKVYHDCGQFYVCKTNSLKTNKNIVTNNTLPLIMPEEEVQDIDNLSDWLLAEMKYQLFINKNN